MWIRFVAYGLLGWCGEIIWTATRERATGRQTDWKLRGTTYLWMLPLYGLILPLYEPVHNALRGWPWPVRGAVYMVGFFVLEYASGWLLRRFTGACPWDYTGRSRFQVQGLIRLDYAPVWFAVGMLLEPAHDFLVRLTPAIQAALGA